VFGGGENNDEQQYVTDVDGTPVVGDLLKITFVENKVVPTILVSISNNMTRPSLTPAGLLLPLSLEQFPPQRGI
jgi:SIT4-associating protein SAP185/190